MRPVILFFGIVPLVAGCAALERPASGPGPVPLPSDMADDGTGTAAQTGTRPMARPDGLSASTPEPGTGDPVAAPDAAGAGGALGDTVASLGNPAEPGLWIKTPLVRAAGPGRIVYPATGASVGAQLIPIAGDPGSGSRMSLEAFQALGAPLTDLPRVQVVAGG